MNESRLKKCFADSLGLQVDQIVDGLAYNSVKQWDSVAHMALVAALEGEFNVMLDTDEIIALSTVAVARDILRKHGVTFP
jgi:acyl carrier protein